MYYSPAVFYTSQISFVEFYLAVFAMFLGSSLAICSSRNLWNGSPFWTSLRQCNISLFAWRFHGSHARCHRYVVYREERGPVLVSSPALHGWEEAQSSRQRDLYDQGGKMAARDVQKEVLKAGNGPCPSKGSTITVHCTGSLNTNPPKKFWRYWFCYECISLARLISRACMSCMWKYFFLFLALLPIRNNVAIRIVLGNIRSRENKTNWFPEGLDVKCFFFHFNSNKRITRANQNSRLGTYNNTNLIPKTTEWMIYEVLSLYCLHLFALLAAISLLGWL